MEIGTKVKIIRPTFTSPGWDSEFWDEVDGLEGTIVENPKDMDEFTFEDEFQVIVPEHPTKPSIILTFFEDELEVI